MEDYPAQMTIGEFYDADEARRDSPEVAFGRTWLDASEDSVTWQLNWVENTGDVYLMRQDRRLMQGVTDAGTPLAWQLGGRPAVRIILLSSTVREREEVEAKLSGWQAAIEESDVNWVFRRFMSSGEAAT